MLNADRLVLEEVVLWQRQSALSNSRNWWILEGVRGPSSGDSISRQMFVRSR